MQSCYISMSIIGNGKIVFILGRKPCFHTHFCSKFESRAIDLTQRHPQYVEIVVAYRQKYLKNYGGGKKETNPKYIQAMKNVGFKRLLSKKADMTTINLNRIF